MSRRLKITLAVIVAASLLTASLGGVVAAAGPVDASGSCPNFDVRQELQLTGFCGGGQGAGFYGEGVTEAVCQLLGLTTEELQTLRLEGNSLVEIAAARGVSEGALVEQMDVEDHAQKRCRARLLQSLGHALCGDHGEH